MLACIKINIDGLRTAIKGRGQAEMFVPLNIWKGGSFYAN